MVMLEYQYNRAVSHQSLRVSGTYENRTRQKRSVVM
jgi:hypothetical protein